ncbi:MAG TPA: NAD(P)H-quinone oxidoreductase [Mycobacteriales bacterium]|nr:NAD(P)H-quinone oxidoreductase [Mycobacteriales bacterium]
MKAVRCSGAGDIAVLHWSRHDDPEPGPGEVLIEVAASAVNRADLLQRLGVYPPPPGVTDVLGLECSGRIVGLGDGVTRWAMGDEVCALLAGGGQAELAVAPQGQVMPVPDSVELVAAGALPEVCATVWSNLVMIAGLSRGQTVLIHGGASGIGTIAIQVAHALGARVITTAGPAEKVQRCRELGADVAISYRDEDFAAAAREATDGRGADVILDIMGAAYLERNVTALADNGRLLVIGLQGGARAELDLGALLAKRATIHATSLRARPPEEKAEICSAVVDGLWPMFADGRVKPVIHTTLPMNQVAQAHLLVARNEHIGKVVLTPA